jgi:DNA processing protein
MNTSYNLDDEAHWAMIAQCLEQCSASLQLSLLDSLHSYRQIFDSDQQVEDRQLNRQLQQIRHDYHSGQWRDIVTQISNSLAEHQAQIVPITSPDYPQQLQQIAKPPPLLYLRGNLNCLHLPQLAIVGSRRMTRGGEMVAKAWAKSLADSGFTITSGLAAGIDACAHRGALAAQQGTTVAVMATGIDSIYPSRHGQLAQQIIDKGGALITEFAPQTPPRPAHFPQRNRIISGLSLGVLVVEAALKSGSLITAKYALEQNREVFAIPGSVNNPQSKGCHQLIKQGACLVETTTELVEEIAGPLSRYGGYAKTATTPEDQVSEVELSSEESQLLEILGYDPILIDELDTPWPMDKLLQLLIALELKEVVVGEHGYYYRVL